MYEFEARFEEEQDIIKSILKYNLKRWRWCFKKCISPFNFSFNEINILSN